MHELSIAQNIVEVVGTQLPKEEHWRIKSVNLRIGALAGVVPESVEFCFHAITEGTLLQRAVLEVERVPFVVRCNSCDGISSNEEGIFHCAVCDGNDVTMISGDQLQVTSIEVSDQKERAA